MPRGAGSLPLVFSRPWPSSAGFLIAANLVPLLMVLFAGWTLGEILALYWLESAVIGLFNILKMLSAPRAVPEGDISVRVPFILSFLGRLFMCAFFAVHFGGFMAVHGVFLVAIIRKFGIMGPDTDLLRFVLGLKWAVLALAASHGFSFVVNYLGGERNAASAQALLAQPYPRIIVMHLTIILGMFLMFFVGRSAAILVLFAALKIGVDLGAHLKEREKFSPKAAA